MSYILHHGDCLNILPTLPDSSVDLIATDPPYFKVKGESWDRQWDTPQVFLSWLDRALTEFYRILKPNGSLYLFASPRMAARVEVLITQRFNVLNRIRWVKEAGWHNKAEKESLRSYLSPWEECVFAEHYGADGYAKGETGYSAKCDELRGFMFEPLRAYLDGERLRAGIGKQQLKEAWFEYTGTKGEMPRHWIESIQWALPTSENYAWLRQTLSRLNHGGEYLRREYEDLRREYEDLRREYEDLRRPFNVSADVPYTDVWTFRTVQAYKGKHPTEKPLDMMRHIITASSKEGATVLDPFMGSGTTGVACVKEGRNFIGIEKERQYYDIAERRIRETQVDLPLLAMAAD